MMALLLHLVCVIYLLVTPTMTEQTYMHEGSRELYTLRSLYHSSPPGNRSGYVNKRCTYPDFCALEQVITTSRICNDHGTCRYNAEECTYWCECDDGFTGQKCQTKTQESRIDPPPVVAEIFNETAFGVVDHDYEYDYNNGGSTERWERRTTSREHIAETCEVVDRGGAGAGAGVGTAGDGRDPDCPPYFPCMHGRCHLEAVTDAIHEASTRLWCECDAGWVGERCELCCDLPCLRGRCNADSEEGKTCECEWGWMGELCDTPVPPQPEKVYQPQTTDSPEVRWLVVGGGVFALLALFAMPALLYYMWKHRVVFVLRLVRVFQKVEESDDKIYDVFVSYRSCRSDESFVVHHLYPKLELEHNFRLCLHFRDFEPGETIANNIIRAIHSSRRTILLLSPSYITSEWARFEYQIAQHEMLKLRHRIIPIILEDISHVTNMDANLEAILRSVTYIKYPGIEDSKKEETFWRKVVLSLPKKQDVPGGDVVSSAAASLNNIPANVRESSSMINESVLGNDKSTSRNTTPDLPPSAMITSV